MRSSGLTSIRRMVAQKFSIGEHGWIAMIEDTEGNIVGLHSP